VLVELLSVTSGTLSGTEEIYEGTQMCPQSSSWGPAHQLL